MTKEFRISNLSELPPVATAIIEACSAARVVCFYGEMGTGKTTLIKEVCRVLGVSENTSSPTFSLVNEYEGENDKIFHFDFYRIKDEEEAFNMGAEEYFYSGAYCFIEWAEKIPNLLPENSVRVDILIDDNSRLITIRNDK